MQQPAAVSLPQARRKPLRKASAANFAVRHQAAENAVLLQHRKQLASHEGGKADNPSTCNFDPFAMGAARHEQPVARVSTKPRRASG